MHNFDSIVGKPLLESNSTSYSWAEANGQGRLKRILSGTIANPSSLQDLRYYNTTSGAAWYDAVGNIMQIADYKAGPQTQAFTYDEADRILTAAASGGSSGNYSETYLYNSGTGNPSASSGQALAVKAGTTLVYVTQASDCPEGALSKAHAVVSAGSNTYCYDQNGNMRRRKIGTTSTYTLTYDAENHLTGATWGSDTATFLYDGEGQRVKATFNIGGGWKRLPLAVIRPPWISCMMWIRFNSLSVNVDFFSIR